MLAPLGTPCKARDGPSQGHDMLFDAAAQAVAKKVMGCDKNTVTFSFCLCLYVSFLTSGSGPTSLLVSFMACETALPHLS